MLKNIILLPLAALAFDYSCPDNPNCVSTLTESKKHKMEAIVGSYDKDEIIAAMMTLERTELIECNDNDCHFTQTTRMGFVDDIYIKWSADRIDFKSASRVGYYDFGVNKKRMRKFANKITEAHIHR